MADRNCRMNSGSGMASDFPLIIPCSGFAINGLISHETGPGIGFYAGVFMEQWGITAKFAVFIPVSRGKSRDNMPVDSVHRQWRLSGALFFVTDSLLNAIDGVI